MTIRAIETRYKGYRFRSRLEARWAVFFDALGVKWEYEIEGFDLGKQKYYLPDFWLPELGIWVEIKPDDVPDDVMELMSRFRDSDKPIALVMGVPKEYPEVTGYLYCYDLTDSSGGSGDFVFSFVTDRDGSLLLETKGKRDRSFFAEGNFSTSLSRVIVEGVLGKFYCSYCDRAVEAARAARFEHGESG